MPSLARSSRPDLAKLREIFIRHLDDKWRTPSDFYAGLRKAGKHSVRGNDWYRIALVLERLANEGKAEIKIQGRVRYFRRAA